MHLRTILLLNQSTATASAVCVRGKTNTGVTAVRGRPSPAVLFMSGSASYGTHQDSGALFQTRLASSDPFRLLADFLASHEARDKPERSGSAGEPAEGLLSPSPPHIPPN